MLPNDDLNRPHENRRRHQQALARQDRRRRRRRRQRASRIRMWRTVNSLQFWTRTLIGFVCVAFLVFWAKFAVVYNIPPTLQKGHLYGMQAYLAEKSWWFGPLAFDLSSYTRQLDPTVATVDPMTGLLESLGQYQTILESPKYIWTHRSAS